MSLNKFEKSAIITILIIGLLGGVVLVYLQQPPIISSVFIAMGISMVVYHFLGGIKISEFNMGPIKLGGSIAALIASAWIINSKLEYQNQNQNQTGEISLNSKHELFDSNNKLLGKLEFDGLTLTDDFRVSMSDSIALGNISPSNFKELGMFRNIKTRIYTEIKYDLKLSPFESRVNQPHSNKPGIGLLADLPFKVKPVFKDGEIKTEIKNKSDDKTGYKPLERGEMKLFYPDKETSIYIVRVISLVQNESKKEFKNHVTYHIYGFSTTNEDYNDNQPIEF